MRTARRVLGIAAVATVLSLVGYQVLAVGPGRHAEGDHGRAFLGVVVEEDADLAEGGARVTRVVPDSAAERAGIREGDVIVSIEGQPVYGPRRLTRRLHDAEPGQTVDLEVIRDGSRISLRAELEERSGRWGHHFGHGSESFDFEWDHGDFAEKMREFAERMHEMDFDFDVDFDWDAAGFAESMEQLGEQLGDLDLHFDSEGFEHQMEDLRERLEHLDFSEDGRGHTRFIFRGRPLLGVQLVDTTPELREHLGGSRDAGVLIGKVIEGMPAEAAGLVAGDLIESVDGRPVRHLSDLIEALDGREGETLSIELIRDGASMTVDVTLDPRDEPSGPRA